MELFSVEAENVPCKGGHRKAAPFDSAHRILSRLQTVPVSGEPPAVQPSPHGFHGPFALKVVQDQVVAFREEDLGFPGRGDAVVEALHRFRRDQRIVRV